MTLGTLFSTLQDYLLRGPLYYSMYAVEFTQQGS